MAQPRSERALRRLVADLATARAEDVEAVLDELSEDQRRIVGRLLDAYLGHPVQTLGVARQAPGDRINVDGHSPAMAARLRNLGDADWQVTDAALGALHACFRKLPPAPGGPTRPQASTARRWSWPPRRREFGTP